MTQFVRHLDFGGTHASLVQHNDRGTKALARIVATSAASLHGLPQDMLFPRTFWRADGRQYATRHNMRSTEGANGQPVAARGVQGWEKMSLRARSATWPRCCIQKLPQAAADRHLSNWNATRRLSHQEKVHRNAGASRPIAPKQPQAYLCRSKTRCQSPAL